MLNPISIIIFAVAIISYLYAKKYLQKRARRNFNEELHEHYNRLFPIDECTELKPSECEKIFEMHWNDMGYKHPDKALMILKSKTNDYFNFEFETSSIMEGRSEVLKTSEKEAKLTILKLDRESYCKLFGEPKRC